MFSALNISASTVRLVAQLGASADGPKEDDSVRIRQKAGQKGLARGEECWNIRHKSRLMQKQFPQKPMSVGSKFLPVSIFQGDSSRARFVYARFQLLLVAALLTTASPVKADNREGEFTLSPFAGGQGFPFGGETHYDWDFNWGVRGGYNITEHFRVELVFGENQTVHDPGNVPCRIFQYGADLLYAFTPDKAMVPFVSAGFGAFDVNFDIPKSFDTGSHAPLADETSAYFNYGVGVEYALTSWFALRAEFHHAIMLDTGDNVFQGTVGFTFQF